MPRTYWPVAGALGEALKRVLNQGLVVQADLDLAAGGVSLLSFHFRAALATLRGWARHTGETLWQHAGPSAVDYEGRAVVFQPGPPPVRVRCAGRPRPVASMPGPGASLVAPGGPGIVAPRLPVAHPAR